MRLWHQRRKACLSLGLGWMHTTLSIYENGHSFPASFAAGISFFEAADCLLASKLWASIPLVEYMLFPRTLIDEFDQSATGAQCLVWKFVERHSYDYDERCFMFSYFFCRPTLLNHYSGGQSLATELTAKCDHTLGAVSCQVVQLTCTIMHRSHLAAFSWLLAKLAWCSPEDDWRENLEKELWMLCMWFCQSCAA